MPLGLRKRKRFERVAALELPPGQWERAWISLRRRDVLGRIALALLAAVAMCVVIHGWEPPFRIARATLPPRDIVAAVAFTKADPVATQAAQRTCAQPEARYVYVQDRRAAGAAAGPVAQHAGRTDRRVDVRQGRPEDVAASFKPAAEGAKRGRRPRNSEEQFRQFRRPFTPQSRSGPRR